MFFFWGGTRSQSVGDREAPPGIRPGITESSSDELPYTMTLEAGIAIGLVMGCEIPERAPSL